MGEAPADVELEAVELEADAFIAFSWNCANVFVAVGLTAKTIPAAQCLHVKARTSQQVATRELWDGGVPGLAAVEPEWRGGILDGDGPCGDEARAAVHELEARVDTRLAVRVREVSARTREGGLGGGVVPCEADRRQD